MQRTFKFMLISPSCTNNLHLQAILLHSWSHLTLSTYLYNIRSKTLYTKRLLRPFLHTDFSNTHFYTTSYGSNCCRRGIQTVYPPTLCLSMNRGSSSGIVHCRLAGRLAASTTAKMPPSPVVVSRWKH